MLVHLAGDVRKGCRFGHGDHLGGHDLPGAAGVGLGVVSRQRVIAGEQPQPPGAALLADGAGMADQVTLAHDADYGPIRIHDGHSADPVLLEEACDLWNQGFR